MAFVHAVINTMVIVGAIGVVAWIIYAKYKGISTGMNLSKQGKQQTGGNKDGIKFSGAKLPANDDFRVSPVHRSGSVSSEMEEKCERQTDPTGYWQGVRRISRDRFKRNDYEHRARQRREDRKRSIYDIG